MSQAFATIERPRSAFFTLLIGEALRFAGDRIIDIGRSVPAPLGAPKTVARAQHRAHGLVYQPNGPRETARRVRQIAAGSLRRANGVVA